MANDKPTHAEESERLLDAKCAPINADDEAMLVTVTAQVHATLALERQQERTSAAVEGLCGIMEAIDLKLKRVADAMEKYNEETLDIAP